MRLQTVGSALRRNVSGHDIKIGDAIIPHGYYVAYHMADIHHDESVYPDPERWDPARYLPHRAEDKKVTSLTIACESLLKFVSQVPYAWVGWGLGRHPCRKFALRSNLDAMLTKYKVGMRFAKLENNLITALWLAMFEYELVDQAGNPTDELPLVNINELTAHKPSNTKYLKYWRRS